MANVVLGGSAQTALHRWPDQPHVAKAFEYKTAVTAGDTVDAVWASPLAQTGIAAEALLLYRDTSAYLQARSRMRRVPFSLSVPKQTGTGTSGGWVPEGMAVGPVAYAFSSLLLEPEKVQTLVPVSKELYRFGRVPTIGRDLTIGDNVRRIDQLFLDPTENSPVRSLAASGTPVTSTGSSTAQITADLASMLAAITTTGAGLTWFMRRTTAARVALALGLRALRIHQHAL